MAGNHVLRDTGQYAQCVAIGMQAMSASGEKNEALQAGHFLVVRSIVRVLPQGAQAKATMDSVIDACAAMQNLRAVIAKMRGDVLREAREEKRAKILAVCTVRT